VIKLQPIKRLRDNSLELTFIYFWSIA